MGFPIAHRGASGKPLAFFEPSPAPFDRLVFSCLVNIGLAEEDVPSAGSALGWTGDALFEIAHRFAPETVERLARQEQPERIEFDEEEEQLRALFKRHRGDGSRETDWLIDALARRSMCADHLWQDMGFSCRDVLNRLIGERFPELATRNANNMKWKKFFYRCLCELEGFTLCAAPSCAQCADYAGCFGEEKGLARIAPKGGV